MRIPVDTKRRPCIILLNIQAADPKTPIRIRVTDAYTPESIYTDREGFVTGSKNFQVRMPISPEKAVVNVYNQANGDKPMGEDPTIRVSWKLAEIETHPEAYDSKDELIQEGLEFVEWFAKNCSRLGAGRIGSKYFSKKYRYRIDYVDTIRDRMPMVPNKQTGVMEPNPFYGMELTTPARISRDRGVIEVSKKYFCKYAIPYRVAILFHEISHFYINANPRDEEEADEHAIIMFLARGYGYIDANNAFLGVFEGAPSDQNVARELKLLKLATDFEDKYSKYRKAA